MHELAATMGILTVALEAARAAGAGRVSAIDVVIGDLSSMIGDSVQLHFDILSRGTPAAGAQLRVRRRQAMASCSVCGACCPVALPLTPACTVCGARAIRIIGGRELHVESIEVDE